MRRLRLRELKSSRAPDCAWGGPAWKGAAPSKSAQPAPSGACSACAGGSGKAFQGSWLLAKGSKLGCAPLAFSKPCVARQLRLHRLVKAMPTGRHQDTARTRATAYAGRNLID